MPSMHEKCWSWKQATVVMFFCSNWNVFYVIGACKGTSLNLNWNGGSGSLWHHHFWKWLLSIPKVETRNSKNIQIYVCASNGFDSPMLEMCSRQKDYSRKRFPLTSGKIYWLNLKAGDKTALFCLNLKILISEIAYSWVLNKAFPESWFLGLCKFATENWNIWSNRITSSNGKWQIGVSLQLDTVWVSAYLNF